MGDGPLDLPSAAAGVYGGLLGYGVGTALEIPQAALLVGALFGWLVVTVALSRRPWVWTALGRRRLLAVPMVAALVPALVLAVGLESEGVGVSLAPMAWLLGLAISGMILYGAGTTKYATRAAGKQLVSWTAIDDSATRRRKTVGAALGGLGSIVALAAMVLYQFPSFFLTLAIVVAITAWVGRNRSRTYEACEYGLRYSESGAAGAQFLPWTQFDSYLETDDAIVLERRWWFDIRMDTEGVPQAARESLVASIDAPRHGC